MPAQPVFRPAVDPRLQPQQSAQDDVFHYGALLVVDRDLRVAPLGSVPREGNAFVGTALGPRHPRSGVHVRLAPVILARNAVAGAADEMCYGEPVWCATDNPFDFTLTPSDDAHCVGLVLMYHEPGICDVLLQPEGSPIHTQSWQLARQILAREVRDARELDLMEGP